MSAIGKKESFAQIAARHWDPLPAWVAVLADVADRTSLRQTADRVGSSVSVLSAILRANYKGSVGTVEERVKGALLGETVQCKVHGEIERDFCLEEQSKNFKDTSALRARVWRACRSGCPHSRIGLKKSGGEDGAS